MYKEIVKPTLVLITICVVISALLSATYNLAGIGELGKSLSSEELAEIAPNVLPNATELKLVSVSSENPALLGVYADEGGSGYGFHIEVKGYAAGLKLMVGLDTNGAVTGIHVIENGETNGIGTRCFTPEFYERFFGKTEKVGLKKDGEGDIDEIANATFTSRGITKAVQIAFDVYNEVKGDL